MGSVKKYTVAEAYARRQERKRAYANTPAAKERKNAYMREYAKSPAGRATAERRRVKRKAEREARRRAKAANERKQAKYQASLTPEKRELLKASAKARRQARADEIREQHRMYRARPDRKAFQATRSAKRRLPGLLSKVAVRQTLSSRVCYYCGVGIEQMNGRKYHPCRATLDHKTPIARGGDHSPDNLAAACAECNCTKHTKTAEEFLARGAR